MKQIFLFLQEYFVPIKIILILLFALFFNIGIKKIFHYLKNRYELQKKFWQSTFIYALEKPLSYYVWFLAIASLLAIIYEDLFQDSLFDISLLITIGSIITFYWFLIRTKSKILLSAKSHADLWGWSPPQLDLLGKLSSILIFILTVVLLMDLTGRNMQTLITYGGIGGIALAFAAQHVIANFFGGLMIYLNRPFSIGDWIHIIDKQIEGTIEEIGWYTTQICNLDKKPIYVPNSIFTQSIVSNATRSDHQQFQEIIRIRFEDIGIVKDLTSAIEKELESISFVDSKQNTKVHLLQISLISLEIEIIAYVIKNKKISFEKARQEILIRVLTLIEKHGGKLQQRCCTNHH